MPLRTDLPLTMNDARKLRDRFLQESGRMPSAAELVAFAAIKEKEDLDRFVQVHFPGNTQSYTYEVAEPVEVGDYLEVWSPHTERPELVRVAYKGRGAWRGHTKIARPARINWQSPGRA